MGAGQIDPNARMAIPGATEAAEGPSGALWYVAYGSPRLAFRKLAEAGFQAFLPMERHRVGNGSKRRTYFVPLFGDYLFVKLWPATEWQSLIRIEGVSGILGATDGGPPVPIDTDFVLALMAHGPFDAEARGAIIRHKRQVFRKDEMLQVSFGQYRGFTVQFKSLAKKDRANVLWIIKGRSYPLTLQVEHLVRAPGAITPARPKV